MKGDRPHREVVAAVETALGQVPRPTADRIRVSFLDPDTIALMGEVGSLAEKEDLGRRAVEAAPGCKVDNSLVVALNRPADDGTLANQAADILSRERVAGIGVRVRGGVAHLTGTADSMAAVEHARHLVAHVPGIADVRTDHVAVAKEQRVEGDIVADLDEAAIIDAIQMRLASEMAPGCAEEIKVRALHRTVLLKGFVRTGREWEQAGRLARSVPGPSRVVNLIVCQDGSTGRNERIEAAIRRRLGREHAHASPVDIKVFVDAGEVFLTGQVDFPEQIDEAVGIAREEVGQTPVHTEIVVTSRHPRPSTGPGHAVEDASGA